MNPEVNTFVDSLNHPLDEEILLLRTYILSFSDKLEENVKWNAPNYSLNGIDCLTLKILPQKNIQLIFHRGAKKQEQPANHLIEDPSGLLTWKENDRAILTFKNLSEIEVIKPELQIIINEWIEKSK
jgi:uncharacterized protein YdeI (YjbR/CyaY-like superfamily)